MALVARKGFFNIFTPMVQVKRFRGKINIQKPKPPHFERAKFIQLAKPYFISPYKDKQPYELCKGVEQMSKSQEENVFQTIIAGELRRWFETSRLVAFFHMNSMNADQQFNAYVLFKKEKMHFKQYGKKTLELAVKDTAFEAVLDFYVSKNMTVFSPEPEIKKLLKITKKFPQLILLAGVYEGKFLNKDELMHYSLIPNLQDAQAGLVQTLNSAGSHLVSHLNSHQTTLMSNLQERIKQLEDDK